MSRQQQLFGSALSRPWALVKWGGNQPNGRRPSTAIAYLTDPIKDEAGNVTGYDGGLVEFYRYRGNPARNIPPEAQARWHYRYTRPRTFAADDVCTVFPCDKGRDQGPSPSMIRAAKQAVPRNPDEEAVS